MHDNKEINDQEGITEGVDAREVIDISNHCPSLEGIENDAKDACA
jgi:hypothetical protein